MIQGRTFMLNKSNITKYIFNSYYIKNKSTIIYVNLVKNHFTTNKSYNNEVNKGNAKHFQHRISVAPMIDISTPHFIYMLRLISGSSPQIYTEMYHAGAIINMAKLNVLNFRLGLDQEINQTISRDNNVVQLGGSDPCQLYNACKLLYKSRKFTAINLNLGCPSTAVQAGEFGAVLMKYPDKVINLLKKMEEAVEDTLPITVKCRLGVDDLDSEDFIINFIKKISENTNIKHYIIHARKCLLKGLSPAKNRSIPPLNYDRVYKLAQTFPHLTFTLNGGIKSSEEVEKHLNKLNNLNGIMIGRQILDNPMFLKELNNKFLITKNNLSFKEIYKLYIDYFIEQRIKGHRPTLLTQPIMKLFPAKYGRLFRTRLQTSPLVRNVNFDKPYYKDIDGEKDRLELYRLTKDFIEDIN